MSDTNVEDLPHVDDLTADDLKQQVDAKQDYVVVQSLDPQRLNTPGGVYLDQVQREEAEIARAKVEGREPDLENASPTAGTVVQPLKVALASLPGDVAVAAADNDNVETFQTSVSVGSASDNSEELLSDYRQMKQEQARERIESEVADWKSNKNSSTSSKSSAKTEGSTTKVNKAS